VQDGIIYIRQKEIIRLEASRSYTQFYMDDGQRHVASKSLVEFENKLDSHQFYRCHKSHMINLHKVQKFVNRNGFFALMIDGSLPDVSRGNKDELLELLKKI
jgi:two-component system LytT family response regulator